MDDHQGSLHLISHFDGPPGEEIDSSAEAAVEIETGPTRGVGWVLRWAAALSVLFYAATVLIEFVYCLGAEQVLARAARAGALEATLPRATSRTIDETVWRRLDGRALSQADVRIAVLHNGRPVGSRFRPSGGDQLAVTLTMPVRAIMPKWLRALTGWRSDVMLSGHAERVMPGHKLIAVANALHRGGVEFRVVENP